MGDCLGISGAVGFLPFWMFPILSFLPPSDVLSFTLPMVSFSGHGSSYPFPVFRKEFSKKGCGPKGASPESQGTGEWLI